MTLARHGERTNGRSGDAEIVDADAGAFFRETSALGDPPTIVTTRLWSILAADSRTIPTPRHRCPSVFDLHGLSFCLKTHLNRCRARGSN